ncbi:carbamoyltransferase [Streptomyces sp. NPDC006692]|uniref:carbamoyltransferase family protein n=1 Tax=Streptomyces sp. NPDC006692 TaxID=3364758 RepID=UPI00367B4029
MTELVLGVSAFYHDSAAALVADGVPVAAAQEERFSRRRHDPSFPRHAVEYCLEAGGITLDDLSAVAYYEDPALKFRRVMATFAESAPHALPAFRDSFPGWLRWKRRATDAVRDELARGGGAVPPIMALRHHASHAASAFFPSPFRTAAVLCIDGVGEWATTTLWHGRGTELRQLAELRFPHSLGLLYSAFTYFCGFKVDSGEYKLMGLAPYGKPRFAALIRERLIDVKPDGTFRLDVRRFEFLRGRVMTGRAFEELFGGPRREPEGPLTEREFDLAASVQQVTEEVVVRLARTARALTGESRLCMAGGVALNCVANGKVVEQAGLDELWVQPAAGDAGGALGAALAVTHGRGAARAHLTADGLDAMSSGGVREPTHSGTRHRPSALTHRQDAMSGALLGPEYSDEQIGARLDRLQASYTRLDPDALVREVASALAEGKIVGWFQGRMEFGPRALGSRSILADPRDPGMQSALNLRTKFRESFRPFAPAVLAEDAKDYFELRQDSPYMLLVSRVSAAQRLDHEVPAGTSGLDLLRVPRSTIPAVTHIDGTARVQTVGAAHPHLRRLLLAFKERTNCPVLINTSFNVRGEPIVNSPEDAYTCFMRTNIDALAIGGFLLRKEAQPVWEEDGDWRARIPVD